MRQLRGFILLTLAVLAAARPKAGQCAETVRKKKTETKEKLFLSSPSVQEERILFHKTAEPRSELFVFFIISVYLLTSHGHL